MRKTKYLAILSLILLAVVSSACGALGPKAQPTVDPQVFQATLDAAATQALQTIVAQITATALFQPPVQEPTQAPTLAVFTPTSEPTATATIVPPTQTPLPSFTPVPPTAAPTKTSTPSDYQCSIVSQSPAFGAKIDTGYDFDAIWKLKNIGTKKWEVGAVDIVYSSGDKLQKYVDALDIAKTVEPGEEITITVDMLAPSSAGTYKAVWKMVFGSVTVCTMNLNLVVEAP